MVKYLFFKQKKRQRIWQNGQRVREMDCILLRDWTNKRITESQSRHLNWFWYVNAVKNNNIGTYMYSLPVFVTETWLYTFYDPIQEIADILWGSAVLLIQGFSPLRKQTFGAGYNHPAVVLQPFFLNLDHFTLLLLLILMFLGLVLTIKNYSQLKAVVRSTKNKN